MDLWRFQTGKHKPPEEWKREGKPEWPDMVRVELSRGDAWRFAREVLAQLQYEDDDIPGDRYRITLFGELSEDEE